MAQRLPDHEYILYKAINKIIEKSPHLDYTKLAEAAATAGREFKDLLLSNKDSAVGIILTIYTTQANSKKTEESDVAHIPEAATFDPRFDQSDDMEVDDANSLETASENSLTDCVHYKTITYAGASRPIIADKNSIQCENCFKSFPITEINTCESSHKTCIVCIKTAIHTFMDSKNINLMCPIEQCDSIVKLDKLATSLDSLIYNQLKKKILKRSAKETQTKDSSLEKILCMRCEKDIILLKEDIFYKCTGCKHEACRICHRQRESNDRHVECKVLHHVGSKCFTNPEIFPANWEMYSAMANDEATFDLLCSVKLNSSEGLAVKDMFSRTFSGKAKLKSIQRVQKPQLWEKYYLKRKHMVEEIGLDKIKERALFHGTKKENIDLICQEGFDMRVPTANGDVFGKGIYFSPWSRYSKMYTGGCEQMIIARVLCGNSTLGSSEMTRPPKDSSGRFYDTTVDNLDRPLKFCVFDNSQCYPAYVIDYSKK
ncbi:uncharacterized protein LOC131936880 [Physella acuta]|uniref:uncharacterized protein LOC131936880 n=1 Tax=Physella acuta TaxID=109671 RepID=UPI0027DC9BB7|nr:uncharacterized protein LOC131936880 [Physella acuta]